MPTAVERLTSYLTRALSLNVVEGAATQALFARLDTQIDAGVAALESATTPKAFHAAERQYGHVFQTFGRDGFGLEREFDRIGFVFGALDRALGGAPDATTGAQADFLSLDQHFFATGADLGAFGAAMKTLGTMRSQAELPGAVKSAATATVALQTDFGALSREATTLVADMPSGDTDAALVTVLTPMVAEFSALATDFGNFTTLLGGNPNAVVSTHSMGVASDPLTFNGVFASLDTHFIALDNSLHGLAAPIANLLVASFAHPHG
jgi:hypothetical protein